MAGHKTKILAAVSVLALSACADGTAFDSWNKEAGAFVDEGYFGNPTMNNTLIQTGDQRYVVNINNRFSSEVPPMVNFEFNSTVLDGTAQATLREQANWIRQFPEIRFRVFGHTDLVGSDSYNRRLGLRRAQRVVSYLVRQGISRSRLEAVSSFGETQPLIVTQERERKNRRTVTEVSGFVSNKSAPLNGKYAEVIFREYIVSANPIAGTTTATLQGSAN